MNAKRVEFFFSIDDISITPQQLLEILNSSCEKTFDEMPANGWIACLKNSMNYFANVIANIAQAIQEFEFHPPANATKPEKVVLS